MRILLTGVGGFIGAHAVNWFLKNTDYEIVGIDSWRPGHVNDGKRLQDALADLTPDQLSRFTCFRWDLTHAFTPAIINQIFAGGEIDVLISMASDSRVEHAIKSPGDTWYTNTQIVFNLLELARQRPVKSFINVSTDEVYGDAGWEGEGHPEWDTILPSNPYSASKAAQEALAIAYWRTYNVPVIITNTMNVIGEWQSPEKFLPKAIKRIQFGEPMTLYAEASGNRTTKRVWLDAKTMAAALHHICQNVEPKLYSEPLDRPLRFHVIGETELSVADLAQLVADKLKKPLIKELVDGDKVRPGGDKRYALVDNNLKSTGFQPPFTFNETLDRIISWVAEQPNWVYE